MASELAPAPSRLASLPFFAASGVLAAFFVVWTCLALLGGEGSTLFGFDRFCAEYWQAHDTPGPWRLMVFLTDIGGVASLMLLTVMALIWQLSHGRRRFAAAWVAIVIGGALANQVLKLAHDRHRPPNPDQAVLERNQSYPSGHAMGSVIGYGLLGYALRREVRCPVRRTAIGLGLALLVLGIGFSRIYLRAHWFSDVIGGWSAGLCWLCFCLGVLERWGLGIEEIRETSARRGRSVEVVAIGTVGGAGDGGDEAEDGDEDRGHA